MIDEITLPSSDEAAAHMFPSDLKKFEFGEHTAVAFSIAMGCPKECSQPLFTLEQVRAAVEADRARLVVKESLTTEQDALDRLYEEAAIRHPDIHDNNSVQAKPADYIVDADKMMTSDLELRRLLAFQYAGVALYRDDGELQDNSATPYIDFLRDSPEQISEKMMQRGMAQLAASGKPIEDAAATLAEICDLFGIGSAARDRGTILENVGNAARRSACLWAVEHHLTIATTPDPDEGDDEPGQECLLNWGADPAEYAEQFKGALEKFGYTLAPFVALEPITEITHCKPDNYSANHRIRWLKEQVFPVGTKLFAGPVAAQPQPSGNAGELRAALVAVTTALDHAAYGKALEQARKALAAQPSVPDGWKLVPIEPTEKMIVVGFESEPNEFFSDEAEFERYEAMSGCQQAAHRARKCWEAMLAAAPTPPAVEQPDIDPCPQCIPGVYCKTSTCGRLAQMQPSAQDREDTESILLGTILSDWHNRGETGDVDGGWLQECVIRSGLATAGNEGYALTQRAMELIGMAGGARKEQP